MAIRGVLLLTLALFLGIGALVLHLSAMCSPHWKITKRDLDPKMSPVSYGLWQRCENMNISMTKQGITLGTRNNVRVCRPNWYMRYPIDKFPICYPIRRSCGVAENEELGDGCSCRYLPSTKGLQWLTVLATVFIVLGLLLVYLKIISSAENGTADLILSFGPFICFLFSLLLLSTGLILLGAYLRRDNYEDYSFPLRSMSNDSHPMQSFDLYSLRNYGKYYQSTFNDQRFAEAEKELRDDADTHYHTNIGRAAIFEILTTAIIFIVTGLTFFIGSTSRSNDI